MPAKSRKLHAHVNPGNSNSTNFLVVLIGHAENGIWGPVCVIEVEEGCSIVKIFIGGSGGLKLGEARPIMM